MTKVWRCMLHGTAPCSKDKAEPCIWRTAGDIFPPAGCRVGAFILLDHVEKVEVNTESV